MNKNIYIKEAEIAAVKHSFEAADEIYDVHERFEKVGYPSLIGNVLSVEEGETAFNADFLHIVRLKNVVAFDRLKELIPHDEAFLSDLWETCDRDRSNTNFAV